ncbi:hypothetical protein [Natrinema sp. CGMCC1.2065]|uniref:hypothetical protein n=1 Tax=Natrinema sp. CGMCC1.2065 TaxID=3445767 RepID=UPI003F4A4F58
MSSLLEDRRDQLKDILLGVELTCFFAFVGLGMFAAGWIKSRQVHAQTGSSRPAIEIMQEVPMVQTFEPVPDWVVYGLYLTIAVLLVAVAIDVWLLLEDDDVNVRETLREWGDRDVE